MAYILDSTTIRAPHNIEVSNSTQVAQHRTLDGSISRDYFGANKRVWRLGYANTKTTDYDTLNTIYEAYLSDEVPKTWQITETNNTVAQTEVHVDLRVRTFSVQGSSYISDFELILTEA